MEPLIKIATDSTPSVVLDPANNKFEIAEKSNPQSPQLFYQDIIEWINKFCNELVANHDLRLIEFNFKIVYSNAESIHFIEEIIDTLASYTQKGVNSKISWYYEEDDEQIQEMGEEIANKVKCNLNLVSY